MREILVTGATGTVGRHVVTQLRDAGVAVRPLPRDRADLTDPPSLAEPLTGVSAVFLVWPFATAEGAREMVEVMAARARRVVYLSSAAVRDHEREIEELIERSGMEWTFLRPHAFAANTLRWAAQVRAGVVREPYGAAVMSPVHERDVAAVAVRALVSEGHHGAAYTLTGPEPLSQAEQARLIGEATGTAVRWEEASPESARVRLVASGWLEEAAEGMLAAQAALVGTPGPATSVVEEVTGVRARTFGEWAAEHAADFRGAGPAARPEMFAARIHEYGDASVISHDRVPRPSPGPGEVLVRVAATSFNPSEVGLRSGLLAEVLPTTFPYTLGADLSGTVAEVGAGVRGLAAGDRVIGSVEGSAAEYVVAAGRVLARAPETIPLEHAAAVPVAGLTAWQAVHEHAHVSPGRRVLIVGAGGGVGMFAVQLAKLAGATVIAVAGPHSDAAARRYGADEVIDRAAVPPPVDVVLNLAVIGPGQAAALAALDALIVTVTVPIDSPRARHFVTRNDAAQLAELVALIDKGELTVEVAESRPLSALADVHRRAEAGQLHGKVVLKA
ncbi:alcohol dehydrogenase catalytic domain-containing protein [Nonomuraea rhizosphaerae]|uniref:alcohol dehydrogenase catalytic domain-containing protein n=1 Tax=Nonomuraea rhizosphaerae TaxID=2665663 RepID=UPI0027E3482F|nr:NAD(P)H-binding protein [Nonomuraea rhizosphaerae]